MIELLLQAERALTMGMVDQAERLYRQAADADPRNSIAVVGLARVALEHADDAGALREARRALAIDPENVAASRLAARLEEVLAYRGETLSVAVTAADDDVAGAGVPMSTAEPMSTAVEPEPQITHPDPAVPPAAAPRRGLVDRLFRRSRS
ncbi:MAG: tetratricopeptide repeat protein [Candidatus Limnocylindrales bacterium]